MNGSGDSNRKGYMGLDELRRIADEATNDADDAFFDKERETMPFPIPAEQILPRPVISETKEIQTMPPPNLDNDPLASMKYFRKIDDESSGEAERIEECKKRMQKVWSALSNREFMPERSFLKSIFLMPFPSVEGTEAKIKVLAFDHDESDSPLREISHELMALTSYKDEDTRKNLSRGERINLVKALTEYYDGLLIRPPGKSDEPRMDLQIDYLGAMEIMHRLNFELMMNYTVVERPEQFPQFRLQRGELMIITPQLVAFFKQKITKHFLDQHRKMKEKNAIADGRNEVRSGIRSLNGTSPSPLDLRNGVKTDRERKIGRLDLKLKKLQEIGADILVKIAPDGSVLDLLRALVLIEELGKIGEIDFDEYLKLFELNDEKEARELAELVALARLRIKLMKLPKEIVASLIGEFLTKKSLSVRPDQWEKLIEAQE